jgi:hypothetical protein
MRLFIFILIFFICSCGSKNTEGKVEYYDFVLKDKSANLIRLNEIEIKEDDEKFIGEIMYVRIKNRKMFISDRIKNVIVVLNMMGEIEKVIGKNGRGPGEILEISNFDVGDNGLIYLYDMGNRRFSIFDTGGIFFGSFNLNVNLYGLTHIRVKRNKLYINVVEPQYLNPSEIYKSNRVAVIDTTGNLLVLFCKSDEIFKKFKLRYFNAVFDFDKFGNIYIAQSGTFRIYKFDSKYKLVKYFGHLGQFKLVDQDIPWGLPLHKTLELVLRYSDTWSIHVRDSLIYYQFVNLTIESFEKRNPFYHRYYLKVYDLDGNYIPSDIELPGRILDVDEDGNIYIYESNEPGKRRIGVYRLRIRDN